MLASALQQRQQETRPILGASTHFSVRTGPTRGSSRIGLNAVGENRLDALRLGDHDHTVVAHREAAGQIFLLVVADAETLRDLHALVDDGPANLGPPADIHSRK